MAIDINNTISLETYQVSNEDLKGYFLANSAFFAGGFENKIKRTRQEIENLTKMIMELNSEGGKEALKSGEITKSDYTKNVTDMSKKDFLVAALKGHFLGIATLGVRGWKRGEELKRLQKELQTKLKEFDDAVIKAISTEDYEDTISNPETDDRLDNVESIESVTKVKSDEVEELLTQIDECEEVEVKLEKVKQIAQEALDNDRADARFGEVTHIALTELFGKVGIENNALLPSAESFTNDRTSEYAVGISLEAIEAALEDINEAREKARNVIVRKVDEVVMGAFNTLGQLERRTKDIEADIKNDSLVFSKTGEVEGGFVKRLSIDGRVPGNLVEELKKIGENATLVYEFTKGGLENVKRELSQNADAIARGKEVPLNIEFPDVSGMRDATVQEIDKTALFGGATRKVMERLKFKSSGAMLGDYTLVVGIPRNFDDLSDIKKVSSVLRWKPWYLGVNLVRIKGKKNKTADAVSKEEALAIIAQIKETFGRINKLRSTWDKIKHLIISPQDEVNFKAVATYRRSKNVDSTLMRRKINFINSVYLSDINGLGYYISYVASTCQAALDLIQKSGEGRVK